MIGFQIIENPLPVDTIEDWSRVRSPARARRRRKLGHPQRIEMVTVPKKEVFAFGDKLVMHPEMAAEFRRRVPNQD